MYYKDVNHLDCDRFDELIQKEGFDVHGTSYDEVRKKIAQLDRVGVLETTIAAMLQKAYQCFKAAKEIEIDEIDEGRSETHQAEEGPTQEEFET